MLTLFAIASALFGLFVYVHRATAQQMAKRTRYGEFKNTCRVMKLTYSRCSF